MVNTLLMFEKDNLLYSEVLFSKDVITKINKSDIELVKRLSLLIAHNVNFITMRMVVSLLIMRHDHETIRYE